MAADIRERFELFVSTILLETQLVSQLVGALTNHKGMYNNNNNKIIIIIIIMIIIMIIMMIIIIIISKNVI